jgi:hypothetical protein
VGDITLDPAVDSLQFWDGSSWKGPKHVVNYVQGNLTAGQYAVSCPIFVCPNDGSNWVLDQPISAFVNAASTSATVVPEVAGAGVTIGSGTNQQGTTVALNALTHQTVNGVSLIAAPTILTAGATLNLVFAGTITGLTNSVITAVLRRVK